MKMQKALDLFDEMIADIARAHEAIRNHSTCSDKSYYTEMDAQHAREIDRYMELRDMIERGDIES